MLSCIDPKNEQMLESHALWNTEEKANQAINRLRNNKQNLERAMNKPKKPEEKQKQKTQNQTQIQEKPSSPSDSFTAEGRNKKHASIDKH
jgi:hypothetical protein